MARKFLCLYYDMIPALEALSDSEAGRLLIAAAKYSMNGEPVTLSGKEAILWPVFMAQIERDNAKYKNLCETNRNNITKRYDRIRPNTNEYDRIQEKEKEKEEEKEEDKEEDKRKSKGKGSAFAPPTLEQVKAYCFERGNKVDAERWFDYYTSNGWKVGRNPMKDWKAAVRTWERGNTNATDELSKSYAMMEAWANG